MLRSYFNLPVPVLMHLNDETSWLENTYTPCAIDDVKQIYDTAPFVFRNYYYGPLLSHSMYIPLGGGQTSYNLQLKNSVSIRNTPLKKSSQRQVLCSFSGRMQYTKNSNGTAERSELMSEISAASETGRPTCYSIFSSIDTAGVPTHGMNFNEYYNALRESVFAPCPGGNNAETFRHYEVHFLT